MPASPSARAEPEAEAPPVGDASSSAGPADWDPYSEVPRECWAAGWRRSRCGGFLTPWGGLVPPGTTLLPDGHVLASDGVTFVRIDPPKRCKEDYYDTSNDAGLSALSERQWGPHGTGVGNPFRHLAEYAPETHLNELGVPSKVTSMELRILGALPAQGEGPGAQGVPPRLSSRP